MRSPVRGRRFLAIAARPVVLVVVLLVSQITAAATDCRSLNGKFTLTAVSGPDCLSTVGLCAAVEFKGGLQGTGASTGTSIIPSVDTPATGVVFATGDNLITTGGGTILTKDAITLKTTGPGDFAEVDVIIGGACEWENATGTITATGFFANGSGTGEYSGSVCRP